MMYKLLKNKSGTLLLAMLMLSLSLWSQNVPELVYYKFDAAGATVQNQASSPVGTNPAQVLGLAIGGTGQFGMGLQGNGGSSSSNYVNTGWATNLGTGPWTISFYINGADNSTTLYYLWGDNTANSFRCFTGGVAGAGNCIIRGGGLPDLIVSGIAPGPTVVHYVYDGTNLKGYKNGVEVASVAANAANINGTSPFKVGGYSTSTGMNAGSIMDEFRVYNRALSATEISQTWNQSLPLGGGGGGGGSQPVTIQIGTGTNTTYRVAWNHFYQYSRTQTIYQKSEINQAGQIQKIAYQVANWPAAYTYNQIKIWMGHTTLPSWTATTQWIDVNTLQLVYDGPIAIPGPGWLEITLQTPFNYNNTDNLVIAIHDPLNVPSYAGSSYTFYYSTTGTNRFLHGYSDSQQWPTSLYMNDYLPNIKITILPQASVPGTLAGVVTNASNGAPVVGAKIQAGDSVTYSGADGSYSMLMPAGNIPTVTCSKVGFENLVVNNVTITASQTTTQDFALLENTNPPGVVFASLNTAQTAVTITWGVPQGPYEIVYDDGQFENMTSWAVGGNINALKFTPINQYPVQITGGRVHIGDGSYPSGANLQPFTMAVYDDDGALGYPNTELATVEVTPTHYGWVDFTFPTPVTITSGNFYLGMIQGGNYPNCVPIAIDETNPSMRSYSRFVTGNAPWVLAGYNDFMIRAIVVGAGGPLDLSADNNVPGKYIEKHRENVGTYSLKIPRLIGGQEGVAQYIPVNTDNGDNSDVLLGYQVWRLKMGEENTPSAWVSVGTPTSTSIIDNSWPTLSCAGYRWAVKAKYTGDRWSDAVFSNVLGKCMTAQVTFNISMCGAGGNPEGTMVQLTNTQYPDTSYFAIAPANGVVTFPHVWKGNYDIWIFKFTYQAWELNDDIMGDKTYNVSLLQNFYPPTNMYVDDRTLLASWNAPRVSLLIFEETWSSGSFATQGWTLEGTGNWGISTSVGMPAPSAQFNWSPSITNYSQSLVSPDITGMGSPGLNLQYDIYLSNYGTTTLEEFAVEIWDGSTWDRLAYYNNANGDIPWTSETKSIDSYTFSTFKVRFRAYGQDSYNINNWNVDNIRVVGTAKAGKELLGYDVYLDNIQIGFTTDTTYQIPHNLCTYGQQYEACVDAAYDCGISERSCYTFTAHYLPAPRNLQASAVQDAAYLTWEHPVMGSKLVVDNIVARSSMPDPTAEYSPMVAQQHYVNATEAIWDVLFTFNAAGAARPGVETDGTYIYTSQWNGPNFGKFENQGGTWTLVSEFTIAGASEIRDMAYDGTYFYGGSASTTIYKMDFNTQTLVGTIATSGVGVRHIGYDPVNQGFWTGNWSDLYLVSMTGATLQTANVGLSAMYGNAYDGVSAGGPYLWIHDQGGSGVDIHQMSIATMTLTGVMHAATDLPGFLAGSIAGGLASDNGNLVPGKFILLVNVQQDPNLVGAYELAASTGGGGGGAAPSNLLGYNVYRNGTFIAYVEKPTTEYYDLYLDPGNYCYDVTAVYDLSVYGFPAGTTGESLEEGPACVDINYGFPIPWTEDWATANFTYNNWSFAPDQGHWRISNMTGNAVPSAEFTWVPPVTDYSYAMITPALNASIFTCADIWLDFDLKLDDRNQTGAEKLRVDIWKNGNWSNVAEYTNTGSFNWQTEHIDISNVRGKAFKVRFVAEGANSADILGWFVDNIHVY
ncbi:MAG: carboxypeptidase regulatory-like domain-containing protein, partial [Bacteroidales bacterium]